MRRLLGGLAAVLVVGVMPSTSEAQVRTGAWGGAGYSDFNAEWGAGNRYIWHLGDYWQQVVGPTGFGSVRTLALDLSFLSGLASGDSQTFDVLLNGTAVGSFTVDDQTAGYANAWTFAPVAALPGSSFTMRIQQTSPDIATGSGATALALGGRSTYVLTAASTVPEPATLLLVVPAAAILGVVRRRRGLA